MPHFCQYISIDNDGDVVGAGLGELDLGVPPDDVERLVDEDVEEEDEEECERVEANDQDVGEERAHLVLGEEVSSGGCTKSLAKRF